MKPTVVRPGLRDRLWWLAWSATAATILYAAYLSSWALEYTPGAGLGPDLARSFAPDGFSIGLGVFGILLWVVATECHARTVVIDPQCVSSRSPLGLYRQRIGREQIAGVRRTPIPGWGRVLELRVGGRWVVFVGNARFIDGVHRHLAAERTDGTGLSG